VFISHYNSIIHIFTNNSLQLSAMNLPSAVARLEATEATMVSIVTDLTRIVTVNMTRIASLSNQLAMATKRNKDTDQRLRSYIHKENKDKRSSVKINKENLFNADLALPPLSSDSPPPLAASATILDTGASHHLLASNHDLTTAPSIAPPIGIRLPNGTQVPSSAAVHLQLDTDDLSPDATQAYIVPSFKHSLLSIGQLCDSGCTALVTRDTSTITHQGRTLLTGTRAPNSGLYTANWPDSQVATPTDTMFAGSALSLRAPVARRIAYYHAICFSPVLSTVGM
jgi:hypothetical protein